MARLKHRLEYAAFRAALAGNRLVGDRTAERIGELLGTLGYPLRIRRDIVERNLQIAFPERDAAWRERIARASYAHLGRETLIMLRLSLATREQVVASTDIAGAEPGLRAYARGRGLVVVAGHFGNWELGAAAFSVRGYAVDAIAKRAANPLFYEHILEARGRLGIGIIDMREAPRQALRAIGAGRAVAFAADQHAGGAGVRVPFFGRPTAMFRGPAVIALRTGAPMVICLPIRRPDGGYDVALEPIDTTPTEDTEADIARITAAWAARLESAVRMHPEQYLWHHRRWREPAPH